jgi:hypothetical protein
MKTIYNAQRYGKIDRDFDTIEEAKAAIEAIGDGRVVTFVRGFDGKDRSCAMVSYDGQKWTGHDIN